MITKAKKAIATFKLREGYPIGCMVTLREDADVRVPRPPGHDRAAPYPRFPRHVGPLFDGRGNYTLGVKEQIIFPEIEYDKIDTIRGMNITITTTAKTDDEARALLAAFRFPFKN